MKITYIITVNSIIPLEYLNILIKSLNLQINKCFNVIFYNQTRQNTNAILSQLQEKPEFEYKFFQIAENHFLGRYALWNLYGLHQDLLNKKLLEEYFMSLHMEEFLEVDYTEKLLDVLATNDFDILLGNLHQTRCFYYDVKELECAEDGDEFTKIIKEKRIDLSAKWGFPRKAFFLSKDPKNIMRSLRALLTLNFKKQFRKTQRGFFIPEKYDLEDIFVMSKAFAEKFCWYDCKDRLYFEDVHINKSLETLVKSITKFPVYFTASRAYHLRHEKYYYQIENEEFTEGLLEIETSSPVLLGLKNAILQYRSGNGVCARKALEFSRKNINGTGTADINYKFHHENVKRALKL